MDIEEITIDSAEDINMDTETSKHTPDISNEESSDESEVRDAAEAKVCFKTYLSNLRERTQVSNIFYVRGLSWQIKLEPHLTRRSGTLGFYLRCNGVPQSTTWSCFAVAELRLLKRWAKPSIYLESAVDAVSRNIRHIYHKDHNEAGFAAFVNWEDLCDPRRGFVMHSSCVEVEVFIKADVPRIEYGMKVEPKPQQYEARSVITYHFELFGVSDFRGETMTSVFYIHNMPFKLMMQAVPEEDPTALSVFLVCLGDPKHPQWNCYVEAELKLMNHDSIGKASTRTFKHLFYKDQPRFGFHRFISWKNFHDTSKGFVKNDTAYFEILVKIDTSTVSETQIDKLQLTVFERETRMNLRVYNISQFKDTLVSFPIYVRNLSWRVKLTHRISIGPTRQIQRYLSVYLYCNEESAEEGWSYNASVMFALRKHDGGERGRHLKHIFCKEKNYSGFSHFIPWHEVLDPRAGFIKNDIIVLMICVTAEEPSGIN